jgi:glutathione S-transferase
VVPRRALLRRRHHDPIEAARARAGVDETRPKLMDFLKRIHGRDAYKRALEKGGAYVYAG